ncbi:MAG: DUF4976 domain-containing protein, partial [Opitutae bacterium]|nr:DUF4976 domain-containing protein [Opitutae bacterium]
GPRPKKKISQPHGHSLWDWGIFPNDDKAMPDMKCAKWAVDQLSQKHDKPFFMGVGFYRPHVPMFATKKWFDMHPKDKIKLPAVTSDDLKDLSQYAIDLTNLEHVSPTHKWVTGAGQWEHAVQSYLASVTFADHCLGLVLDALEKSEYADNTIIALFSDHGFHLGEKERWAKRSLWEDGTRVPVVVVAPGYKAGQKTNRPAELLDIFPTLLELAGLPKDESQEGQSLVPLMKNPDREWKHPAITSFGLGNYSIRSIHYRFIQYFDGSRELYDLRNDPHEWNNLIDNPKMKKVNYFMKFTTLLLSFLFSGVLFAKPLKVFILCGQSNMEGHAKISTFEAMKLDPVTKPIYKEMVDASGNPVTCDHVWITYFTGGRDNMGEGYGKLTAGYGSRRVPSEMGEKIGPEFTFGIYKKSHFSRQIVL